MWETYHNFRISVYFGIMLWALVFHFSIGMLFERYGSVPEIIRNIIKYIKGTSKEVWETDKARDQSRFKLKPIDPLNFEREN